MTISVMTLALSPFFKNAPASAIKFAASHMHIVHLKRREILNLKDAVFNGLGIVIQGGINAVDFTLDGKEVALLTAGKNDIFGHQLILSSIPSEINWISTCNSTTIAILEKKHALNLLKNYPELMMNLAKMNSEKIQEILSFQKIQAIHPVSSRICAWLLNNSKQCKKIHIPKHAEIAFRLNTTRESVNRVLKKLANDSVISKDGNYLNIEKRSELIKLIKS